MCHKNALRLNYTSKEQSQSSDANQEGEWEFWQFNRKTDKVCLTVFFFHKQARKTGNFDRNLAIDEKES